MTEAQKWLNKKYPTEKREKIKKLDISKQKLEGIFKETVLNGSLQLKNFPNLKELDCSDQLITSLEFINCPSLDRIICQNNLISNLKVSNLYSLGLLNCNNNKIEELDLSDCTQLTEFRCASNNLLNLNLDILPKLKIINCAKNQIESLDTSSCREITELYCSNNQLKNLNINNCRNINTLCCSNNLLTEINLSDCYPEKLVHLDVRDNNFPKQDLSFISRFTKLEKLWIGNSKKERVEKNLGNYFFGSLEYLQKMTKLKVLEISNTDIDSGLEYLPSSIEDFLLSYKCQKDDSLVFQIKEILKPYYKESSWIALGMRNYNLQKWRENNADLFQKKIMTEEDTKESEDMLINFLQRNERKTDEVITEEEYLNHIPIDGGSKSNLLNEIQQSETWTKQTSQIPSFELERSYSDKKYSKPCNKKWEIGDNNEIFNPLDWENSDLVWGSQLTDGGVNNELIITKNCPSSSSLFSTSISNTDQNLESKDDLVLAIGQIQQLQEENTQLKLINQKQREKIEKLEEWLTQLKTQKLLKKSHLEQKELRKLTDVAKNKIGENLCETLENLLEAKEEILKSNNYFAIKQLEKAKNKLDQKLTNEEIQTILGKQVEISEIKKQLSDLETQKQLQTQVEISPK